MKPLASALTAWKPQVLHPGDPLAVLQAEWAEIVGDDVAAQTRPAEIVRDALVVVTRSSAWSQQLAFLSERVLSAVHERTGMSIGNLRFRVGRIREVAGGIPPRPRRGKRVKREVRTLEPAPTLEAALERFRADVTAAQRARTAAGWKECPRCGARTHTASGSFCVPCSNAHAQERDAQVARLLYEAPWLGYAGIAPLVQGLRPHEYDAVRLTLLRRWKDTLERIRRSARPRITMRDRSIASSYVLLKSQLEPDKIAPAVVRDLLGDELHDILYGNENS
jgi:Dna[CI] antecedent, DciA